MEPALPHQLFPFPTLYNPATAGPVEAQELSQQLAGLLVHSGAGNSPVLSGRLRNAVIRLVNEMPSEGLIDSEITIEFACNMAIFAAAIYFATGKYLVGITVGDE